MCFVASMICNIRIFFFFFKQKTAYEMRISDWSSDVRSSDLLPCRQLHVLNHAAGRDAKHLVTLVRGPVSHVDVLRPLPVRNDERPAVPVGDHRRLGRGEQIAEDAFRRVVTGLLPRSEEHTSELQSLMRLSYAVF